MYKRYFGVLGLSAAVLAGCNEDPSGPGAFPCDEFLLSYGETGTDTVTTTGGLKYIDVETGTGTVTTTANSWATVHFSGYTLDPEGDFFQSSCESRSAPVAYHVGTGQLTTGRLVIEGFSYGVLGMKVGGVRRVIIPAALAYPDPDPMNSLAQKDLIFDLHLVRLQ